MSTAQPSPAFSTENSSGQSSENVSLRASLVPYREWWAFLQSTPNPFREEEPNDERTNCDAQATLIHRHAHNSHREYSLFSSTHRNSLHSSRVFKAPEDNYTTPPSPTGSDLTITPSRYTFAQNMTESKSSSQDLLSNSTRSKGLGVEKAESVSDSKNKGISLSYPSRVHHVVELSLRPKRTFEGISFVSKRVSRGDGWAETSQSTEQG